MMAEPSPEESMRALVLAFFALNAQAANLAADSLLCESPKDLEYLARQNQAGKPASAILRGAQLYVDFMRKHEETRRMMYVPKSRADEETERAETEAYKSLLAGCAASVSSEATILERKPISGILKIRTTYQGRPAELWTFSASVTE